MLRHRRKINDIKTKQPSNETPKVNSLFEANQSFRELKNELESLRLENKLNLQMKKLIDKRMNQLEGDRNTDKPPMD